MAETALETGGTTPQQPPRPGRGGKREGAGRPEGSLRPKPDPAAAAALAPEQADDFFDLLRSFPEADWKERKFMYLYRTAPITDRKATGQDLNLMKYMKPIDSHDVMLEFGSGGYKILLDEFDPATQKTRVIRTHYFKIFNQDHPPKIPFGEWLDDERNKDWLWAKPKLLAAQAAATTPAPQPAAGNEVGLLNAVVAAVKELRPNADKKEQESLTAQVMKMMGESHKEALAAAQKGPGETIALVNAIVGAIGGNKSGPDPMLTHVLDELKESRKENSALMMRLLDRKDEPKSKSVREELLEIKTIADDFFGGGRSNGKSDMWDAAREVGIEVIRTLGTVAQAIGIAKVTGKPGQPGAPAANPDPNRPALTEGAQPPTPEQRAQMMEALNQQFGSLLDNIAPHLLDHFKAGQTGMYFRDEWFLDRYGSLAYDALAQMSVETIVALFDLRRAQAPDHVKAQLAELQPPQRFAEFIAEFISDEDSEADDAEPNIDPLATVTTAGEHPKKAADSF
jgi:hypothetical protein